MAARTRRALLLTLGALTLVLTTPGAAQDSSADGSTHQQQQQQQFTLFHRAFSSASSSAAQTTTAWQPRALVRLTQRTSTLEPQLPPAAAYEDLLLSGSAGSVQAGPLGKAEHAQPHSDFYQLVLVAGTGPDALRRAEAGEGPLTSIKKCHLVSTEPTLRDELSLHLPSAGTLAVPSSSDADTDAFRPPVAISYSIPGLVLGTDACPLPQSGAYAKRWTEIEGVNTTIRVGTPVLAADPPLRAPIPVKEDGTPDTPPPEKSFLQKYWMYLVPILILMFIPAEAEHSGSAEHDSSSNRPPPRELAAQRIK
ncbi:hypothetical protein OC842_001626 [Tilletia horrida]|uniref:ER membrane protein complex subunit 10 n=1 Tax=Tilletia horrida TaxID=155126 RepID=A0AAN6GFA3_9BASI|nr:hypothetical protein OC842_001626 [Tilletia horrida]